MVLSEKIVNTEEFGGTVDIITGIDDFEPTCTYNEEFHTYRIGDKIIPSVTRLLDDGTYANIDPKILESAQMRGILIHKEIEQWLKGGINGFTDEFWMFLDIFTENKQKFAEKAIFDIKTYASASPKNREKCLKQEKMYAEAIKYLTGEDIEHFYMIHLPRGKKGKLIELEVNNEIKSS
ncbi:MAG: hypothetical protein II625_00890 [Bacilli bacterium]|nr:hypothetical protein [Bacilli bacterium]